MVTDFDSNDYIGDMSVSPSRMGKFMSIGYREVVDSVDGATLSRDESARRLRKEIDENGIEKIFRYPLNGIPKVIVKPSRRPA